MLSSAENNSMSQIRETATDRLVSIIQLIQFGKRTGVLTARRGEGVALEEGSITFSKGQVTRASIGRHTGAEALNMLTTWGNCRFLFLSSDETETGPFLQLSPSLDPARNTGPLDANGTVRERYNGYASATPQAPYRIRPLDTALRMIENLHLSRAHRQLLLLIDGHRTVTELARLMSKSEQDITKLLQDLEQASAIQAPKRDPFP
jgi:hypothetical protein